MRICLVQHNFAWRGKANSEYSGGMVGGFFNSRFLGLLMALTYSRKDVIVEFSLSRVVFCSLSCWASFGVSNILYVCMYVF